MIADRDSAFIIAEMSANHMQDFGLATRIVEAAKEAGADAIKLQTYTPDTITLPCASDHFTVHGTIWQGRTLHDLYGEAYCPWEWQPRLKAVADALGLLLFSTPFDATAVDFLEGMGVPCHKIASFELVDLPLIRKVARTGKPVIMSTGMASEAEIDEAVNAFREAGGGELSLLKCTSAYPARPEEANLRTIPYLASRYGVPAGLSDHTPGIAVPIAAVALGARIIEKHFCLDRSLPGPDSSFSLEPAEFRAMVDAVRTAEKALGRITFELTESQKVSAVFRRSLFVVQDVAAGEVFTERNVRSIRPGHGLHTRHHEAVMGRRATRGITRGTPLAQEHIEGWNMREYAPEDGLLARVKRDPWRVQLERFGDRYARYRKQWLEAEAKGRPGPFPLHVDIDVADCCNMRCTICHQRDRHRESTVMPPAILDRLFAQAAADSLCAVNFGASAEPLMHQDVLFHGIEAARAAGVMDIFVHTNGLLLTDAVIDRLLRSGVTNLCVSLDAATGPTYRAIRGVDAFERIEESVRKIIARRDELGLTLPIVRVSFCDCPANHHEKDLFLAKWEQLADLTEFQVYRETGEPPKPGGAMSRVAVNCLAPFRRLMVWPDGVVSLCCGSRADDVVVGSLAEATLGELWRSGRYAEIREAFAAGRGLPPTCAECLGQFYEIR